MLLIFISLEHAEMSQVFGIAGCTYWCSEHAQHGLRSVDILPESCYYRDYCSGMIS